MIYPLEGPKMKGVVTLVVKKLGGKYAFRLLSVDLPEGVGIPTKPTAAAVVADEQASSLSSSSSAAAAGGWTRAAVGARKVDPDSIARIYVIGDPASYQQYKLLAELREPLLYALQQQGEFFRVKDELEEDLGHYTCPDEDEDQVTLWDKTKAGGRWGARKVQQLQMQAGTWYRKQQLEWEHARIRRQVELEKQQQQQRQAEEALQRQAEQRRQQQQQTVVVVAEKTASSG
jgi:hypothetical protein